MFAAKILVEIILVLLLAYGFWHEKEIVEWENKQIRKFIRRHEKRAAGRSRQLKETNKAK